MAGKDFYEVLGVAKDATAKDIKAAYRRLARKHHPDVNQGDKASEEKFKAISEAYEVLGDDEKRKKYDTLGSQWDLGGRGGPAGPDMSGAGGFNFRRGGRPGGAEEAAGGGFDFTNIFEDLFSGARNAPQQGENLQYELEVGLEEVFSGGERRLTITAPDSCPTCRGTGAEPGSRFETCPQCKGSGRGMHWGGFNIGNDQCERCHGAGQVPAEACHTCRGTGQVERPRAVTVAIPKGVDDGRKLRLAGKGNPGANGAPAGDLFLTVRLRPHPIFERKGHDLYVDLPVTFPEAALGAEVQVPTVTGKVTMRIPAGVQSGQQLRLSGQGLPRRDGTSGDLFARLKVTVPKNLTDEERALIEQLATLRLDKPRERLLSGR